MSTSFIMLVIGCPPTIIAYSTGFFSQVDFVKVAIPWCLILLVVATLGALIYWPMIGSARHCPLHPSSRGSYPP